MSFRMLLSPKLTTQSRLQPAHIKAIARGLQKKYFVIKNLDLRGLKLTTGKVVDCNGKLSSFCSHNLNKKHVHIETICIS
jgi:hypothetical protein